jgi:hypothetical protein
MLVSVPWSWRDNSAETCSRYVKDCSHKLQNNAFLGVIWDLFNQNSRAK